MWQVVGDCGWANIHFSRVIFYAWNGLRFFNIEQAKLLSVENNRDKNINGDGGQTSRSSVWLFSGIWTVFECGYRSCYRTLNQRRGCKEQWWFVFHSIFHVRFRQPVVHHVTKLWVLPFLYDAAHLAFSWAWTNEYIKWRYIYISVFWFGMWYVTT